MAADTVRRSDRNQLEMELAEIRRIIRTSEAYLAAKHQRGELPRAVDVRSIERQRAIEARLLNAYLDLACPQPNPPLFAIPPATEHHGPEDLSCS